MLTCERCKTEYKHASSLSRHKKNCSGIKRIGKGRPYKQNTLTPPSCVATLTPPPNFDLDILKQLNDLKKDMEKLKLEQDLTESRDEFNKFRKNMR